MTPHREYRGAALLRRCRSKRLLSIVISSVLLALMSCESHSAAGQPSRRSARPWEFQISQTTLYDGNVLRYSEKYLERFRNSEDYGRFHIRTYDDLVVRTTLKGSRALSLFSGQPSSIEAQLQYSAHTQNSINNWVIFSFGVEQHFGGATSASMGYSFIPNFYVRHYRDRDWVRLYGYTPETFKPFEFSKDDFSLSIEHALSRDTRLRVSGGFSRYFHNKHFTEYDSENWSGGVYTSHRFHRRFRATLEYRLATSRTNGTDRSDLPRERSEKADASFKENEMRAGSFWQAPLLFGFLATVQVSAGVKIRSYLSERPVAIDPLHAGRRDYQYSVRFACTVRALPSLNITPFYVWTARDARSRFRENDEYVSEEKDFRLYQLGIDFRYTIRF